MHSYPQCICSICAISCYDVFIVSDIKTILVELLHVCFIEY